VFGSRPLKVELWQSKGEIDQEKKQRENREMNSFMNALLKGIEQTNQGPQQNQFGQPQTGYPMQYNNNNNN
jgi:hypothetical protein